MRDFARLFILKLYASAVRSIPISWNLAFARFLGRIAYYVDPRRSVAYVNIKAAFPGRYTAREIKVIVKKCYVHFAQALVEILYFPKMNRAYADRYVQFENRSGYDEAFASRRGTMLMTAHAGNWEFMQIFSGLIGNPMPVLAHEQKIGALDHFLNELRASHGSTPILTRGMQVRNLIEALKNGSVVGVLGDQSGGREGMIVRFFGRKTTAPSGLFSIALRTAAQVLPCFSYRVSGPKHVICFKDAIRLTESGDEERDNKENYEKYLRLLENFISEHPDQWFWIYKRWKFCFTKRIVVFEDVKPGHATQAVAIADHLSQILYATSKENEVMQERIQIRFQSPFKRALFFVISLGVRPFAQGHLSLLRFFLERECYQKLNAIPFADFIVSCGSGLAPLNLWLAKEFRAKTISVMRPPAPYSRAYFDLVVLPKHDRACRGSNCIQTTIAPNLVSEELLQQSRQALLQQVRLNGTERISVFIGGKSKQYEFDRKEFNLWLEKFRSISIEHNFDLLITTSRRTGPDLDDAVKKAFAGHSRCKLLVIANEKNIAGVAYGMLALSDIVVVTEDSVSMISEALSSGKRVMVLKIGNQKLPKKFKAFQEQLIERNLVHVANAHDFEVKLNAVRKLNVKTDWIEEEKRNLEKAMRQLV